MANEPLARGWHHHAKPICVVELDAEHNRIGGGDELQLDSL